MGCNGITTGEPTKLISIMSPVNFHQRCITLMLRQGIHLVIYSAAEDSK